MQFIAITITRTRTRAKPVTTAWASFPTRAPVTANSASTSAARCKAAAHLAARDG